jgi:peptide/nickel transport system substrate-binding protein
MFVKESKIPRNLRRNHYSTDDSFGAIRWLRALGLASLLAACAPAHPAPPANLIRFSIAADPQTLDPLFIHPDAASVEQQLARLTFEPFLDFDARGNAVPALLAEIPTDRNGGVSADGRTIVFRLRHGVRWSDGVPVTSRDVLFTLHAILDPRNPVRSHEGYELIDRATAPGDDTVVLHLRHAWAPAVATYFSYGVVPQAVLPAHLLAGAGPLAQSPFGAAPVGDGPFRLLWWHRGEGLRYAPNVRYWKGAPQVGLDVRIAPDPSTNLVMLQSAQLDWNLIAPSQLTTLLGNDRLSFLRAPSAVVAGLAFNTARAPFDDPTMRRAVAMSIDRAAISRKITLGYYPVANSIQPPFSWAYDPSIRQPAYDPAGADRLFAAAGWHRDPAGILQKNGRAFEALYVQFPESNTGVRVAAAVQAALRERGISVEVKSISNAQLFMPRTGALATGRFDLAYVPWTMGPDPDDSAVLACDGTSNYMRWCDPAVTALESAALVHTDRSVRRGLYRRIASIAAREVPILYLFDADYTYAYVRGLQRFDPGPFVPTWNAWMWRRAKGAGALVRTNTAE